VSSEEPEKTTTEEQPQVEKPEQPSTTGTPERYFDNADPMYGTDDFEIKNEGLKNI
jgi:hypothetical protein